MRPPRLGRSKTRDAALPIATALRPRCRGEAAGGRNRGRVASAEPRNDSGHLAAKEGNRRGTVFGEYGPSAGLTLGDLGGPIICQTIGDHRIRDAIIVVKDEIDAVAPILVICHFSTPLLMIGSYLIMRPMQCDYETDGSRIVSFTVTAKESPGRAG